MINRFAAATLDHNWYHVDEQRARTDMPGGKTIAHGLLSLSLVPGMAAQIARVRRHGRALNYGCDRVRYPAPVPVDSRIRQSEEHTSELQSLMRSSYAGLCLKKKKTKKLTRL